MQIDFHHTVTYVLARAAGFNHEEADIISHAAQYVDDAVRSGAIRFDNDAMYTRISSAHKIIDPHTLDNWGDLLVWVPFHFLPGNGGMPAGQDPDGSFIHKIICKPGSDVAREMVAACICDQNKPYALHRLGVTMHVYADTWAHQGFAGVLHQINEVRHAEDVGNSGAFGTLDNVLTAFLAPAIPAVGHGQARELPDMPFLSWRYTNGAGEVIERDNTAIFLEAADEMCKAMQRFRLKNPGANVPGLPEDYGELIRTRMANMKTADSARRHEQWLADLAAGAFPFGSVALEYSETTWIADALEIEPSEAAAAGAGPGMSGGTAATLDFHRYHYRTQFLSSDWKLYHDALQLHRLTVLHDILPKYGICSG